MTKILTRALIDSSATTFYVVLVALLLFSMGNFSGQEDTVVIPMAMLLLFVCSAGITGFLVFGKPIMLYIDGKKREAVLLLGYTLGILVLITIILFISLVAYYNFL